jgi:hypothetical protein
MEAVQRRAVLGVVPLCALFAAAVARADERLGLEPFSSDHFSLTRPSAWALKDKAGAAVLFQDPTSRMANVGVTVSPVKVRSLAEFGQLDAVAEKLVAAELAKDGTLSAEVKRAAERRTKNGALLYEVEYETEHATRGRKAVLNAVCIDDSVLYIYALQYGLKSGEAPPPVAALARTLLASFEPGL